MTATPPAPQPVPSPDAPPRRPTAWRLSLAALLVWVAVAAASVIWILVRPPCRPGWVRPVDLAWVFPVVAAVAASWSAASLAWSRAPGRHPVLAGLAVASVLVGCLLLFAAVRTIVTVTGEPFDPGCWSF